MLSIDEVTGVIDMLSKHFSIDVDAEITLEANPDDLSKEKIIELSKTPVNRLSIGIQSFRDEDLKFLNRIHTANDAIASVKNAQEAGFNNITIDLIYGIQTLTNDQWRNNIQQATMLGVPHISSYSLTVEPKTALSSFITRGQVADIDPQKSAEQFEILMDEMSKENFVHYEISNFCKEGLYSRHNSNYWKGEKYLGLGPSAHSYNGSTRQWNVKSNSAYINGIEKNIIPFEKEELTESQKYNEYILTALRTIWGVDLNLIKQSFPDYIFSHLEKEMKPFLDQEMIFRDLEKLFLSNKGKLFADKIASSLFFVS